LVAHFHNGFSYWIYGCMGVLAALFMWKFVPETKGKTLEELEALWEPETKKTQLISAKFAIFAPERAASPQPER
ncbi:MFS transporter, partial [Escherichia coli]|nr:MFS transporter [Escherichia coli]